MERYAYLQTMPNSPLTPLTPLSENAAFDFNFGGDGSLDVYIDSVRQKYRVEQQQQLMSSQQQSTQKKPRRDSPTIGPKQRFSERFRKIREVFEPQQQSGYEIPPYSQLHLKEPPKQHQHSCHQHQQRKDGQTQKQQQLSFSHSQQQMITPRPIIKIVQADTTPQNLPQDYVATPTNVRTPLKQRNHNVILTLPQKMSQQQQQQKLLQQKATFLQPQRRPKAVAAVPSAVQTLQHIRQASPVTLKPLCPHIYKILHQRGLSMYCGVFQREEIDMFTFKLLTLRDLQQMGITNPKHCDMIMADVCYARQYY